MLPFCTEADGQREADGVVATARAFQGDVQRHLYAH